MAVQTFGDVWRKVALHVPGAPSSLVQGWVQDAYEQLCGRRHWSFLRTNTMLRTLASRSVTVTFTQGSLNITSAGEFVVATDPGRQIRAGAGTPIYTINTVADVNTATLTELYAEADGAKVSTISDIYLPMPADFRSFEEVTDMTIQRPIAWWISRDRLDLFDPGRIAADTRFRVLAANQLSTVTSLSGRVLYEAWPYPTAAGTYLVKYFKRCDQLGDDDPFLGPLATMTGVLEKGALAEAAKWPGTEGRKNPYFNLTLANRLDQDFLDRMNDLNIMDDDLYLMDLQQIDLSKFGLAALSADTTLMRESDATLADYY